MDRLLKQFETGSLKGFGIHNMQAAIIASGAILHYLDITQHTRTSHITSIARIEEDRYVRLDRFTVRNLELLSAPGGEGKSLLDVIDRTVSPLGARLMRSWIACPMRAVHGSNARWAVVGYLFRYHTAWDSVRET